MSTCPDSRSRRRLWLIAGAAALATAVLSAGVIVGRHLGAHRAVSPPTGLIAEFAQLEPTLHAVAGVEVSAAGAGHTPIRLGQWQSGPAWSTIKVPMAIAALREKRPPLVTGAMTAAITESDNAAAESVWASLGDPVTAAHKVDDVLRQAGDPTVVQSQKVRPEFSASGQTEWALADQVRFLSVALCDSANDPIFALMGRIQADQRWGLGSIPGSRFKGGWGPTETGGYLVRQMGVIAGSNGMVAIALAARPDSGRFEDGTAALTEMAGWLTAHLSALPAGRCNR
ncbi:hypothetical protein [Mycobacterium paraterrae]|uniref:Serine hydrolase n=1 Tax=Mycobacterium paraterrae TaxID=577492 RepID=A0ABY3VRK6_9MYCO|nr:hypothetical protein [Mycobacterium paraterrae]UMB71233.1 hypothetical protein MKK62_08250 [Mycobacterium paraterrae]